jgi:hypothetical protein
LTLAVRSTRGGRAVFYHPEEGWSECQGDDLALDAFLSFAEGMGFLFDEDPLEAGLDRRQGERIWADFLREPSFEEGEWGHDVAPEPADVAAGEVPAGLLLSKFRFLSAVPAERLLSPPPPEEPAPRNFVLRLLSRF